MSTVQRRYGLLSVSKQVEREKQIKRENAVFTPTVEIPEGFEFFKLPTTASFVKIDILPFISKTDSGEYPLRHFDYYIHRNLGTGKFRTSVVCPRKYRGLPCPICEDIYKDNYADEANRERYNSLKPQHRMLCAVRWVDAPVELRDRIYIYDAAYWSFGRLIDEKINSRDLSDPIERAWDNYFDLLEGYTLKLNLTKSEWEGHEFAKISSVEFKNREQQYTEDMYDKVPDLSKMLNVLSYDNIEALYYGKQETASNTETSGDTQFNLEKGFNPISDVKESYITNESTEGAERNSDSVTDNEEVSQNNDTSVDSADSTGDTVEEGTPW